MAGSCAKVFHIPYHFPTFSMRCQGVNLVSSVFHSMFCTIKLCTFSLIVVVNIFLRISKKTM